MDMELEQKKQELCDIAKMAYLKGMVCGTGGNISFRNSDCIYITPSGYTLDALVPGDLICVDIDGHYKGCIKPSIETFLHLQAYLTRPDAFAVVHLHSYYSVLVGLKAKCEAIMPAYTGSYACKVGNVRMVPFYKSGAPGLAGDVSTCLHSCSAVLLRNHGILSVGENLRKAFSICEDVEVNARMHITLCGEGALTDEQVAMLRAE